MKSNPVSWFATYRLILLIFAFITGVSTIASFHEGLFHGMQFMAVFWRASSWCSLFKFWIWKGFASAYAMYDIVAKKDSRLRIHLSISGACIRISTSRISTQYLRTGLRWLSWAWAKIGVIESVLNKRKIRCVSGAVFNLPMSTVTIIEDLLMVVMAALMLVL